MAARVNPWKLSASSGHSPSLYTYVQVSKQNQKLPQNQFSSNYWDPLSSLHNKLLENVSSLEALTNLPSDSPPFGTNKTLQIKIHIQVYVDKLAGP